jgi:hypothetical protein
MAQNTQNAAIKRGDFRQITGIWAKLRRLQANGGPSKGLQEGTDSPSALGLTKSRFPAVIGDGESVKHGALCF